MQKDRMLDSFTLKICNLDGGEKNVITVPLLGEHEQPRLDIAATYVLDDYIALLNKEDIMLDMIVISIRENRFLYSKKKIFDGRNFIRSQILDTSKFANNIVSFRQKMITLYRVTEKDVDVITLEVEDHGLMQYCKFFAWDKTYLAHPFQAMPLPAYLQMFGAEVEHKVFCWEQETWHRKCFKIKGGVHEILLSVAVHSGKLYSAQAGTIRVWDIQTETLIKMSRLNLPIPVPPSFPSSFLIMERIGLHLQPELEYVVGLVTGHLGNRAVYTVAVFDLDWDLVASVNIPTEKDLQQLELHLLGPRVIVLYSDNHYSVVDLEILHQKQPGIQRYDEIQRDDGIQHDSVISFPLGSSQKKGRLVSHSLMKQNRDPGTFTLRNFEHVSEFNIVINQTDREIGELIHSFSFL